MRKDFYSNGKLLLTGEYAVLDGAVSLAVPTKYGQSLSVMETNENELRWKSSDEHGKIWFESSFDISPTSTTYKNQLAPKIYLGKDQSKTKDARTTSETLSKILRVAKILNPDFLMNAKGFSVETELGFPRDWGLGSSSTLINNIAQWAEVDAYQLLWNAFSGSGYDIACAQNDTPIKYRVVDEEPSVTIIDFDPTFKDQLYFVHLNKKQNSRDGIKSYREKAFDKYELIKKVSEITEKIIFCKNLSEFQMLVNAHELLLSQTLGVETVKNSLFPDFKGSIKSLGAWGGDFVLATGNQQTPSYFKKLGYTTVLKYVDMVLKNRDIS